MERRGGANVGENGVGNTGGTLIDGGASMHFGQARPTQSE